MSQIFVVSLQCPKVIDMPSKNIFNATGKKAVFINLVYKELMKRGFVSYANILSRYKRNYEIDFNIKKLSSGEGYGVLKKAFPEVIRALEEKYPGCIADNGKKGKGRAYKYIGVDDNPLAEERQATEQKSLEDYVTFCKASAGIMPASWFSSFFENTQLLLDMNREVKDGDVHISSSMEQNLTNIHLLPIFFKAITNKQVLRFDYQPFGQEPFTLTFHPQFLKEYNGRWFVFGEAERLRVGELDSGIREPYKSYNAPLDRIVGEVSEVNELEYIPAPKGFYQEFFKNIIGVTHEEDVKIEQVVIRTRTEYQHGLMLTKKLHESQIETLPFGEHDGEWYGEIQLTIEPNRELQGKILTYGQYLEVIQPLSLREQMKDIIKQQMDIYFDKKK